MSIRDYWNRYDLEIYWSIAALLLALLLTQLPLVNVLGYEFSACFCILLTISSGHIGVRRFFEHGRGNIYDAVIQRYLMILFRISIPFWLPPVVMGFNRIFVPNCDLWMGIQFYLFLTLFSLPAAGVWVLISSFLSRNHARWIYSGIVLVSVLLALAQLALEPPIVLFHSTLGYYAGSIYDEGLSLPQGLIPYRLMQLAFVCTVVSGLQLGGSLRQKNESLVYGVVFCVSLVLWGGAYSARAELGIERDRADIVERLGGRYETEHFVIHYPINSSRISEQIVQIASDHEFRWSQLARYFEVTPEIPVHSFIYASPEQKGVLMGASRTLIARPWSGEFHITYDEIGDGHLTHEMAHLFTAPFGEGILRLAGGTGIFPNIGMVEGIATAAAWDSQIMTYHGWTAALVQLDMLPQLEEVLQPTGFWARQSRTVYTMMGSFARWLIDEQGMERFRQLYASGDYEEIYGQPLVALVGQWRQFLDEIEVSDYQLSLARYRFDRPTIFERRCARSLAERSDQASMLSGAQRYQEASDCMATVVEDDPHYLPYRLRLAQYQLQSGEWEQARENALTVLHSVEGSSVLRANAAELMGDISWSSGDTAKASAYYESLEDGTLFPQHRRRITIKREAIINPRIRRLVFDTFLAVPPNHSTGLAVGFMEAYQQVPSPLLGYLLGSQLLAIRDYERATQYLQGAVTAFRFRAQHGALGWQELYREAQFRYGKALLFSGHHEEAEQLFQQMASEGNRDTMGWVVWAEDWRQRAEWFGDNQ